MNKGLADLMKALGAKYWDPLPADQHKWQRAASEPPLYRMWSWLVTHTVGVGHRSAYAVSSDGRELHMEHAIKDLEMDHANAYRTWREGVAKGLWRAGTDEEGRRRLYLTGKVRAKEVSPVGEEKAKDVCADSWPPYILQQIKKLNQDQQVLFWKEAAAELALEETLRADLDAVRRRLIAERQDTLLQRFGVKVRPQKEHVPKNVPPEIHEQRKQRVENLLPVVAPVVHRYAQTVLDFAHSLKNGVRTLPESDAQTSATLLTPDTSREPQKRRAGEPSSGDRAHKASAGHGRQEAPKYLHSLSTLPALTEEEQEAENLLWTMFRHLQEENRHTDFGSELLSRERRCDVVAVRNMLVILGAGNVNQFILWVSAKMKGIDRNGLAKLPSRAPGDVKGPRSLGLFTFWAKDYAAKLDEAARERVSPQRRREEIAAAVNILRDPDETDAAKQYARDLLHTHGVEQGASA